MTGLEVSPVAFGTWQLGGEWGRFDEDEGIAAIRRARELGVNLFDTAQGYGLRRLSQHRRRHQAQTPPTPVDFERRADDYIAVAQETNRNGG